MPLLQGWHANEMGEVHEGDKVVIFGAGPVGQVAAMWAKYRGAERVMVVDHFGECFLRAQVRPCGG